MNGHGAVVGPAETVDDYDIAFDVVSRTNQCAAADLVVRPGCRAWGVLYEIPDEFIRGKRGDGENTLAEIEGPNYEERAIQVRQPGGNEIGAVTFLVRPDKRKENLFTGAWYVSWIVYGLRERGVPEEYIQHVLDVAIETNKRAEPVALEQIGLIEKL